MCDIGVAIIIFTNYVICEGQMSNLEDIILNCKRSEPTDPTNLFYLLKL